MTIERTAPSISREHLEAAHREVASLHRREGQLLVEPKRCRSALDILLDESRWDWDGYSLLVRSRHGKKAEPKWIDYRVDAKTCIVDRDETRKDGQDETELRPCKDREIWIGAEPDFYCKHRAARLILERAYEIQHAQTIAATPASVAA